MCKMTSTIVHLLCDYGDIAMQYYLNIFIYRTPTNISYICTLYNRNPAIESSSCDAGATVQYSGEQQPRRSHLTHLPSALLPGLHVPRLPSTLRLHSRVPSVDRRGCTGQPARLVGVVATAHAGCFFQVMQRVIITLRWGGEEI